MSPPHGWISTERRGRERSCCRGQQPAPRFGEPGPGTAVQPHGGTRAWPPPWAPLFTASTSHCPPPTTAHPGGDACEHARPSGLSLPRQLQHARVWSEAHALRCTVWAGGRSWQHRPARVRSGSPSTTKTPHAPPRRGPATAAASFLNMSPPHKKPWPYSTLHPRPAPGSRRPPRHRLPRHRLPRHRGRLHWTGHTCAAEGLWPRAAPSSAGCCGCACLGRERSLLLLVELQSTTQRPLEGALPPGRWAAGAGGLTRWAAASAACTGRSSPPSAHPPG